MQILVYTVLCGTGSDSKHKTYHRNFLVGLEAHHGYVSVLIKPDDDMFYLSQSISHTITHCGHPFTFKLPSQVAIFRYIAF